MTLGPEGTKIMVAQFAEALSDLTVTFIEALSEAAPTLVERMIEVFLIEGGLERIVVALIQATPRIAYKLTESFIRGLNSGIVALSERFGLGIVSAMGIPEWVTDLQEFGRGLTKTPEWVSKLTIGRPKFIDDLNTIFVDFNKRLTTLFNFLPNAIAGLFGGGGGDAFGTAGHKYLAKGGVVYAAHGFVSRGTDTVPAVLTPGERVLTVNQNQSFEQLPALLGQLLSVLSEPMVTSTSIDIDGNRLADVMLQLNRRNARVAA